MDSYEKEILFSTLAFLAKNVNSLMKKSESDPDKVMLDLLGEKCADIASKYQKERTKK